ncbi:hypothetical protein AXG93_723s1120 [Marchantia polymorpha subsp. ruderalis]|uniref:Integrase catalytic domain-containing protein n=1 Tax=Marchantia polymorpha subsp. ruderalis TaxID=1480154 RepID=A0A176VBN4_MARPO|nr:hypothetical protein AXG93_723s1120 [Marchantia polymorpha subsp. ruderalis]
MDFLLWGWNWVSAAIVQAWNNGGLPKPPRYRENLETWKIWNGKKVLGCCARDDDDLTFDSESVKLRSPNARVRTKMKARRLILKEESSTETRAAALRGRPNLEAGLELKEETVVREKEVPAEKDLWTSAVPLVSIMMMVPLEKPYEVLAVSSDTEEDHLALEKVAERAVEDVVLLLLHYLDRKRDKHAETTNNGSYMELVRNRTRAKVAATSAAVVKEQQLRDLERRATAMIASSVNGHRQLAKKLDAFLTNRGGEYLGSIVPAMLEYFFIKARVTTSYKPNANGLTEPTNYTLCMMLAKDADMNGSKHNWDKRLHAILWEYRTTWKTSTGYSPFRMVYGVESKLPIQFDLTTFTTIQQKMKKANGVEAVKSRQQQLMELELELWPLYEWSVLNNCRRSITTNEVEITT